MKPHTSHIVTSHSPVEGVRQKASMTMTRALLLVLAVVAAAACLADGKGGGECGGTPPEKVAQKLAPCAAAGKNPDAAPSSGCCNAVHTIGKQSPECLCAVMLSKAARKHGIKPEVAITIPKRCNLVDRPVGYKCGDYTLP